MLAVLGLALVLRLPFITGLPDTPDGVRFIRSVERFDLLEFSPHFPGYPVAVLLARWIPLPPGLAWATLSAIAGSLAAVLVMPLGRWRQEAWFAALFVAAAPFASLEALRVGTDTLVLPCILGSLILCRRHPAAAGLLLGLALGIRPSAFPWCAALLAANNRRQGALGLSAGILLWLLPTLAVVGAETYLSEGWRFTWGHFSDWGRGTGAEQPRWLDMLRHWIAAPLGNHLAPALATIAGLGLALRTVGSRPEEAGSNRALKFGALAYAGWILLAQNPQNSRHVLPLAILALASAGSAIAVFSRSQRWGPAVAVACLVTLISSTVVTGVLYRQSIPPAMRVVEKLAAREDFDWRLDRVYTTGERAYFSWQHPEWDVASAPNRAALEQDLAGLPIQPRHVWFTGGLSRPTDPPPVLQAERTRFLGDFGSRVTLHRITP